VSDNYLRLIPTDPTWQPGADEARRAVAALWPFVPAAESIDVERYDEVRFIDPGANFERVSCPTCRADLATVWWTGQMEQAAVSGFTNLTVLPPCCGTPASLNDLGYDWPAGFARAELSVVNPNRGRLDDAELARVTTALGHPLRQVMAHQ